MTQVWSATQINAHLSGGGTTTLTDGGTSIYSPAYGSEGFTTGKFYCEGSPSIIDAAGNTALFGIGNTSSSIADGQWLGIGFDTLGIFPTNSGRNYQFFVGGGSSLSIPSGLTFAPGDRFGLALDLTNNLVWINNVTQSGAWFGALTSGDPAAGTNGFSLTQPSYTITAQPVVPACTLFTNGTTYTAYFAQASWMGAAPSGFGPFDAAGGGGLITSDASIAAEMLARELTGVGQRTIWWRPN